MERVGTKHGIKFRFNVSQKQKIIQDEISENASTKAAFKLQFPATIPGNLFNGSMP
jgi:hypothetical protein